MPKRSRRRKHRALGADDLSIYAFVVPSLEEFERLGDILPAIPTNGNATRPDGKSKSRGVGVTEHDCSKKK